MSISDIEAATGLSKSDVQLALAKLVASDTIYFRSGWRKYAMYMCRMNVTSVACHLVFATLLT